MYGHIFSVLLILCIFANIRELRTSSERPDYAKNISLFSLLFSAAWNYFVFLIHFVLIMQTTATKIPLLFPTVLLFFYTNIFQMQTFIHIWKSRNAEFIATHNASEDIRYSLFSYNCKLYLAIIAGIYVIFNILMVPSLLLCFLACIWIPQIIQNIMNSASKAPSLLYLISVSVEFIYIPVFLGFI